MAFRLFQHNRETGSLGVESEMTSNKGSNFKHKNTKICLFMFQNMHSFRELDEKTDTTRGIH